MEASNGVKLFGVNFSTKNFYHKEECHRQQLLNSIRICRKRFTVCERCKKFLDLPKQYVCMAVDIFDCESVFILTVDSFRLSHSCVTTRPKK